MPLVMVYNQARIHLVPSSAARVVLFEVFHLAVDLDCKQSEVEWCSGRRPGGLPDHKRIRALGVS